MWKIWEFLLLPKWGSLLLVSANTWPAHFFSPLSLGEICTHISATPPQSILFGDQILDVYFPSPKITVPITAYFLPPCWQWQEQLCVDFTATECLAILNFVLVILMLLCFQIFKMLKSNILFGTYLLHELGKANAVLYNLIWIGMISTVYLSKYEIKKVLLHLPSSI